MSSFSHVSKLSLLRNQILHGDSVTRVDLSNEGLAEFPPELFSIKDTVEFINFGNNELSSLPPNMGDFVRLKILFFAQNKFKVFPSQLSSLPMLYMLSFKSNQIEEIPENSLPSSLSWLILTDNKLRALPKSIGTLTRLRKVMLSGNRLESLPAEMSNCKNIELIRLSVNNLNNLPVWLTMLPKLAWIAYSGNPFHGVSYITEHTVISKSYDWNELKILNKLGEGASGTVYRASFADCELAAKVYKGDITSDGVAEDEIKVNESIGDHPSFVALVGRIKNHPEQKPGLLLKLLPEGEYTVLGGPPSFDSITRDTFSDDVKFCPHFVLKLLRCIASGCQHLHSRGIIHGDLYAHNILVNKDGGALLTDFGAASISTIHNQDIRTRLEKIEVRAFGNLIDDLFGRLIEREDAISIITLLSSVREQCLDENILARPSFLEIADRLMEL